LKISNQEILYINAFNSITKVTAKGCMESNGSIIFLVNEMDIGKAIGKKAFNIKKIEQKTGKRIEVLPFSLNASDFFTKSLKDIKFDEITEKNENGKKSLNVSLDAENKSKLKKKLFKMKGIKEILKKQFGIENIRMR